MSITLNLGVHPETLVETYGLLPINDITNEEFLSTLVHPITETIKITTERGYYLECGLDHKLTIWRDGNEQKIEAGKIISTDFVKLHLGSICDLKCMPELPKEPLKGNIREKIYPLPTIMSNELGALLGLMVADGTIYHKGFRVTKRYSSVTDKFCSLISDLFEYHPRISYATNLTLADVSSVYLSRWMSSFGGLNPNDKFVPDIIFRSPLSVHAAFLQGLFEDGTVNIKNGIIDHIHWDNMTPEVVNMVQVMLLRFGIVTTVQHRSDISTLYIYSEHMKKFSKLIGFMSTEKNAKCLLPTSTDRKSFIPVTHDDLYRLRSQLSMFEYQNGRFRGYLSVRVAKTLEDTIIKDRSQWLWQRIKNFTFGQSATIEVFSENQHVYNGFS